MSRTPQTDAEEKKLCDQLGSTVKGCVPADFARGLERQRDAGTLLLRRLDECFSRGGGPAWLEMRDLMHNQVSYGIEEFRSSLKP